jgi:hypothetical protein
MIDSQNPENSGRAGGRLQSLGFTERSVGMHREPEFSAKFVESTTVADVVILL